MVLYTKTGDKGETSLANGGRVKKTNPRIAAVGDIDELNSFIGLAKTYCRDKRECELLLGIQRDLFTIGAQIAQVQYITAITGKEVERLEKAIDAATEKCRPLGGFILPGGSRYAALLHVCRTVCCRTERSVVSLNENAVVDENLAIYLNRLSDLFFALARKTNADENIVETEWKPVS
ncbi:MAG: cob(I)yrinic acid a,c-diamide adenosyltransferase [Candidatus Micrarchaeota archaeon]